MVYPNPNLLKLQANYLFVEIGKRKKAYLDNNPNVDLINLGVGDTTEPLSPAITEALSNYANILGQKEHYMGYGPDQGFLELRENIASINYQNLISSDEIYVSDGAKPDIARLQAFFGPHLKVALQDPAYPVYIDGSIIANQCGQYNEANNSFEGLALMPCTFENNFFPNLNSVKEVDLIYICSPHNPTGTALTKEQLKVLIDFAKEKKAFILYDAAYSTFIQNDELPKSIYEVEGAKEVAIEINSFSKSAGFTGVRLGWSIVPKELKFQDGRFVKPLFDRFFSTAFNGASILSQKGALAYHSPEGQKQAKDTINLYLNNAKKLKECLSKRYRVQKEINSPYIWAYCGEKSSWDYFNDFLENFSIVTVPGCGFGHGGEGFIRFSAFNSEENIVKAVERLESIECLK